MPRIQFAIITSVLVALTACQRATDLTGIAWMPTYPLALEAAIEGDRPMLLYFSAAWCGICRALEAGALSDARIQRAMESYVTFRVDIDHQRRLAEKYQVVAVPSLLIVSPEQKVRGRSLGDQDVNALLNFLRP